jgi:hypothetical protein
MKLTLLDMVQTILSSMDSDEVNSINDNVEAQQVSLIVRSCYEDIVSRADLPEQKTLFELTASGDDTKPTLMTRPDNIRNIDWIKYNTIESGDTAANYRPVMYMPPTEFMNYILSFDTDETDVGTFGHSVGGSTIDFHYRSDGPPQYYTSYNDTTMIFDSYDSEIDTTLQQSKTMCFGSVAETFSLTDGFIPNLDEGMFPLLLRKAEGEAWAKMKQTANMPAEREERRQWIASQRIKKNTEARYTQFNSLPNYGRK